MILHRRRLLGVIFRETVNERELETSKETKKEKNLETRECASLLFCAFLFHGRRKEVCLFCQSAETSVF